MLRLRDQRSESYPLSRNTVFIENVEVECWVGTFPYHLLSFLGSGDDDDDAAIVASSSSQLLRYHPIQGRDVTSWD